MPSAWCAPSVLTPKRPVLRILRRVSDAREGEKAMSGGSSATEMNDSITSASGPGAVTSATPVGKRDAARRTSTGEARSAWSGALMRYAPAG
jgi:hypothetical protein